MRDCSEREPDKTMIEPNEDQYQRLRKLGQELHIPTPEAFVGLEVRDKNGKLIQKHKQRSHSWVRNAYNLLLSQLASINVDDATFGAGKLSLRITDGAIRDGNYGALVSSTSSHEALNAAFREGAAGTEHGILVGSGTNAESFEDYVLQTLIAEGTGAGELNYAAMDAPTKSYAGLAWTVTWIRYMNNNSGGNVSINEVALVTHGKVNTDVEFVMSRDKLGSTVTVPDTGQLKVTYTIQLTYPS